MQKISFVKNKFSQQNIKVGNDWFQGCMEHFIDENPQITENELFDLAMNQWLLTDLNEMECKCFPEEVLDKKLFLLEGKYPVQMSHILDISESAYDQYRNFFGKPIDEVVEKKEWTTTAKKKRMLRLELSDGAKTINAMEMKLIPILNTKLNPGCKFMLSGPIRCINKTLLLDQTNITLLGGEVEEFLIENAYENVLRKLLGFPINPDPIKDYKENMVQAEKPKIQVTNTRPFVPKTENFHSELDDDNDLFLDVYMTEAVNNQFSLAHIDDENNPNSSVIPNSQPESIPRRRNGSREIVNEYENIMDDEDDDWLLAVSQEEMMNDSKESTNVVRSDSATTSASRPDSATTSVIRPDSATTSVVLPDSTTDIKKVPQEVVRQKSFLENNYPFKIDSCNLVSLSQLRECSDDEMQGKTFIVFCKVYSVTEKLGIKYKKWKIGVLLADESESVLLVKFDNNLMEDVVGHTALEMETMKNLIPEKPTIADEIMRIIANFKNTLKNMHCFMKIAFNDPCSPFVIKLLEPTKVFNTILERKFAHEQLNS